MSREEEIVRYENGRINVSVPVTYAVHGEVELTFDTIREMKESLRDKDYIAMMELPSHVDYIEDSYLVDIEAIDYSLTLMK